MAENPMLAKMLANMLGLTPQQLESIATDFSGFVKQVLTTMQRIEANQHLLIEAENERRAIEGRSRLISVSSSDNGPGSGTSPAG